MHERARATPIAVAACALLVAVAASPQAAAGDEVMTYIHHPPESVRDVRYLYQWEVLRTALEKTTPKWGPYRLVAGDVMTERRQAYELRNATGNLTVMYLGTTPDFERELVPVRIPIDRSLGGYCVFLVRAGEQARFDAVRTLDDLRQFTYGLGSGWIDVEILRSNGFKVVTGSSYDGLFEMLVNRRFDVFLRGAVEILDEYEQRKAELRDLRIEDGLDPVLSAADVLLVREESGGAPAGRARGGRPAAHAGRRQLRRPLRPAPAVEDRAPPPEDPEGVPRSTIPSWARRPRSRTSGSGSTPRPTARLPFP